jgi:hypothetical protein
LPLWVGRRHGFGAAGRRGASRRLCGGLQSQHHRCDQPDGNACSNCGPCSVHRLIVGLVLAMGRQEMPFQALPCGHQHDMILTDLLASPWRATSQ